MASIKDLKRMCEMQENCTTDCPLSRENASCLPESLPDNADEIVDKWVQKHPVKKTYAMDFFEKFPNASRNGYGVPKVCLKHVYGDGTHCSFSYSCTECWNKEMKEGAKNE